MSTSATGMGSGSGLRIAYVINSLEGGGAASPVPAVTRVLRAAGAEVEVFALLRRNGRGLPAMQRDGLTVHIREGGDHDHLATARWLDRALRAYRPNLLWTSLSRATLLGNLVGRWRHIPVVSWQHNAYLKPINQRLLRLLRHWPVAWVCDSDEVAALTAQRLAVEPERLFTWPLFAADPEAPQANPWQPGQPLRLGSLGRLHPAKGYDVLLAALALLAGRGFRPPAPVQLVLSGEGAMRDALAATAAKVPGIDLQLPGFDPRPLDFLAGLHLYLQPSRREGLCIALHEAMQAGLPVIASRVGQMPYTIAPDFVGASADRADAAQTPGAIGTPCGWLVPPEDPAALADALAAALAEPARLAALGQAARARVLERFSQAAFAAAGRQVLAHVRARQGHSGG